MDDEKSESRNRDPGKNVVAGVGLRGKTTTIAHIKQKKGGLPAEIEENGRR